MTLISQKKITYSVNEQLRHYLLEYDRETSLPVTYADLARFTGAYPLLLLMLGTAIAGVISIFLVIRRERSLARRSPARPLAEPGE